jgi:hypothetical protein
MGYLGSNFGKATGKDIFVASGNTYTLSYNPGGSNGVIVFINGLVQTGYSVSGNVLTFLAAPTIGATIVVVYIAIEQTIGGGLPLAGGTNHFTGLNSFASTTTFADIEVTSINLQAIANYALLNSPIFTGTPVVPGYATLASPSLTGIPLAPTAASGTSSTQIATTAFVSTAGQILMPAGSLIDFAGIAAPAGFLQCPTAAGGVQLVSRTTYAALFAAIGTTWGAGDGSTTFGIPWFPAGYASIHGTSGVGGTTAGAVLSHTHGVNDPGHNHGNTDPTHTHSFNSTGQAGGGMGYSYGSNPQANTVTQSTAAASTGITNIAAVTGVTVNAAGGTANLPAGVTIMKCVKY